MSEIAQKIYELKMEIEKTHPNAKIVRIVLNIPAEWELIRQLYETHRFIELSPAEMSQSKNAIKRIFGISMRDEL